MIESEFLFRAVRAVEPDISAPLVRAHHPAVAVGQLFVGRLCIQRLPLGWTEHLFDAWFRVLVLPAEGETLDAESASKELADCYSRVMGADKWRRYVRLYRPDGTEEKF